MKRWWGWSAYASVASANTRGASGDDFCYEMMRGDGLWPFDADAWKPSDDPVRNLVRAGALIVAELDRLQRKG